MEAILSFVMIMQYNEQYLMGMKMEKAFIWLHHMMINANNLCSLWKQHSKENIAINFAIAPLLPRNLYILEINKLASATAWLEKIRICK